MARNFNQVFEIRSDFIRTRNHWDSWRDRAKESKQFRRGVQWTNIDKKYLDEQRRPVLVFNKILQHVDATTGTQRQNRFDAIVKPVEENDFAKADIMNKVLNHIKNESNYEFIESQVFEDAVVMGVGWFGLRLDTRDNPDGEIIVIKEDPLKIMVDPNSRLFDISDAEFIIKSVFLTKEQLKRLYPKKANLIERNVLVSKKQITDTSEDSKINNMLLDISRDTDFVDNINRSVRVIEKWHWKYSTRNFIVNLATGENFESADSERAIQQQLQGDPVLRVIRKRDKKLHITTLAQHTIVEDREYQIQIDAFPFVPIFFYKDDREVWGLVENLKDYNREINKRRSQMLAGLNKQVSGGYEYVEGTIDEARWRQNPDLRSVKGNLGNVRQINQPELSSGLFTYDQYLNQDMQEVGVSRSARGFQESAAESGRLFGLRVQQSNSKQQTFFDNLRLASKLVAEQLVKTAQQIFTTPRILRIVGEEGAISWFEINTEEWNNIAIGKFDVRIDEGTASISNREYQEGLMVELFRLMVQGGFPADALPWHLIVRGSDHPKKDQIADFVEQKLGVQTQGEVPQGGPVSPGQLPGPMLGPEQFAQSQGGIR